MTPDEAREALAADEVRRIEAFVEAFHALEDEYGVTVTVRLFLTPDGRMNGEVIPVAR